MEGVDVDMLTLVETGLFGMEIDEVKSRSRVGEERWLLYVEEKDFV